MSTFLEALPILMAWDRCLGYIRLWHDGKLSEHDTFEAIVAEIATANGDLNRRVATEEAGHAEHE